MKRSFDVKNKNKNIDKFFSGKLPDPEIPAEDAWGKMNDMLNAGPSGLPDKHMFKGGPLTLAKLLSGLVSLGVVILGVFLFLNNNAENTSNGQEKAPKPESALIMSKEDTAKVGESVKIDESEKAVEEGEALVKSNEFVKSEELVKSEALVRSEESGDRDAIAGKKEARTISETERGNMKKAQPVKRNRVVKVPESRVGAAKMRQSPDANQKNERLENVAGERDEHFADRVGNGKAASEISSDLNVVTESYKGSAATLIQLKSQHFKPKFYDPGFSAKIKDITKSDKEQPGSIPEQPQRKTFEAGLEWNLISPLKQTDFLFTGIDSTQKPALLLIPGIYISKTFRDNHSLTLSASAYQPYFGNHAKLDQNPDSISGPDSSLVSLRRNLIKTASINLALQYQYELVNHFTIGAGVAYSRVLGALVQEQVVNGRGELLAPKLVTLKGSEQTGRYLNKDIFYFKAGLSYKVGRFQAGFNILAPLSNLSASPKYPIRKVNGQLFLRFRVW
ncbi:hypothetical protein [Dyadobacter sp. CY351]|uniref:hypothetical protein n=1 Tax=Dyadobacter sp. CY351 TaxID=2909337 RepID=UPI001F1BBA89|nr:hypothetical protein [Dyadobacter sp. CY351]MCF2520332.1 hypothetical protein [Dyadobacter sp. CY351]